VRRIANRVSGIFGGIFTPPETVYESNESTSNNTVSPIVPSTTPGNQETETRREHFRLLSECSPLPSFDRPDGLRNQDADTPGTSRETNRPFGLGSNSELRPSYDFPSRLAAESDDRPRYEQSRYDAVSSRISEDRLTTEERPIAGPSRVDFPATNLYSERSRVFDDRRYEVIEPVAGHSRDERQRGSKMARMDMKTADEGDRASESSETSGCSSLVPQADKAQTPFMSAARRKTLGMDEKLSYGKLV